MPYIEQDKLDEVISDLKKQKERIDTLEKTIKEHQHSGFDDSRIIESSIILPGSKSFKIGDSVDLGVGKAPTPAYLNIGGGAIAINTSYPVVYQKSIAAYGSLNIADIQNLKSAKRWNGMGVFTTNPDDTVAGIGTNENIEMVFSIDKFDTSKGQIGSNLSENLVQIELHKRTLARGSYFSGLSGPFVFGATSISIGGTHLIDNQYSWATNYWNPVGTYYALLYAEDSVGNYNLKRVLGNIGTQIEVDSAWTIDGNVSYYVYFPIMLGASFLPWRGIRVAHQAEIKGMGKETDGFVLFNPKNLNQTAVAGAMRNVEIRLGINDVPLSISSSTNTSPINVTIAGSIPAYACWHLNELSGVIATDSSGNGRNGTLVLSPVWVTGKLNNALYFGSISGQWVDCGDIASFERTESHSYEFWFNSENATNRGVIVRYVAPRGILCELSQGHVYFRLYTSGANYLQVYTTTAFSYSVWHHCVITYNGSSLASGVIIYVDGSPQALTIDSDTLNGTIINAGKLYLASRGSGSSFYGKLDEIIIYNLVLTASQVTARYNGGSGIEWAEASYETGDTIFIQNHLINTNANGTWTITRVDANNFTLNSSTGNGVGGATGTSQKLEGSYYFTVRSRSTP